MCVCVCVCLCVCVCVSYCGKMSTVYCYVRNAGPEQYIQYSLHLLNLRQSKRNPHKHSALDVCLSLENAWEDTYQIFISVSLGSGFQRGGQEAFSYLYLLQFCMVDFLKAFYIILEYS